MNEIFVVADIYMSCMSMCVAMQCLIETIAAGSGPRGAKSLKGKKSGLQFKARCMMGYIYTFIYF